MRGVNGSVAARINELFDVMHPAGEPQRTNSDIAQQVARRSGASFTEEDLRLLRSGASHSVPARQLSALAECFGVASSYLVAAEGNADVAAQLRLLKAMRDQGVRDIYCSARIPADTDGVGVVNALLAAIVEGLGR